MAAPGDRPPQLEELLTKRKALWEADQDELHVAVAVYLCAACTDAGSEGPAT